MSNPSLEAQIAEIQAALSQRCDALGALVADNVWREVPFYAASGPPSTRMDLERVATENLRFIINGLGEAGPFDTTVAGRTGTDDAIARVPLQAMMEGYRIACRTVWEDIVTLAAARPEIGREALIRATARIWLAQDVFTHAAATAYRDETTRQALTQEAERAALVEALIEGKVVEQASLWDVATMLRLPARGPYVIVAAECAAIGKSALPGIEAKLTSLDIPSAWRLLPDVQLGIVHVASDGKFATLTQTLNRVAATRIGISSRFDDLGEVTENVTYARITLASERHGGALVGVFEAAPLAIAAASAPRIMSHIASTVLAGLDELEDRERDLLFATFREWVACAGSIDVAAEQLFCHPNTVRHRLKRIEERTGKSLRHPRELAELSLAFEIALNLP